MPVNARKSPDEISADRRGGKAKVTLGFCARHLGFSRLSRAAKAKQSQ